MLRFKLGKAADARTDRDTAAVGIFFGKINSRIGHSVCCRGHRKLSKPIEAAQFLHAGNPLLLGIPRHFAGKLDPIRRDVKERDRSYAAVAAQKAIPENFKLSTKRCDDTKARHYNASFHSPHHQT